jgi:predicted DNA-binding protein YlxM (UPF0122 family)
MYLKRDDVRDSAIGDYRKRGFRIRQIADMFEITQGQVRYILKREKRKEMLREYQEKQQLIREGKLPPDTSFSEFFLSIKKNDQNTRNDQTA